MAVRTAVLALALTMGFSVQAVAVTWAERQIEDPVDGSPCKVPELASMGSYIYAWPEKFDQVFVPVTSAQGLWYCPGSGFASFIGDTDLQATERERIAEFLRGQPLLAESDLAGRLRRAESVYALRELSVERQALIHRILGFTFETLAEDPQRAGTHRKAALNLMLQRLADESLAQSTRLEYLFVSANYLREFGERERADRLLDQLRARIDAQAGNAYAAYLASLLAEATLIEPGARLAPEPVATP